MLRQCRACNLTVFETFRNCRENNETISLKQALWRYLKRMELQRILLENNVSKACILMVFETAEKKMKVMSLKHAIWQCMYYLKLPRRFWGNESKWCVMPLFGAMFWRAEKNLKAMTLNGDAFETYATFGGGAHGPANGNVVSNEDSSGKEWDVYALCNVRDCRSFLKVILWETYDIHEVLSLQRMGYRKCS